MNKRTTSTKRKLAVAWSKPTRFKVPIPKDEPQRLASLFHYRILDTPPEEDFDNITAVAAQICDTPIALISFVDSERQWFKSKVGLTVAETSRDIAFCAHAIVHRDLFVVADATKDERFEDNPLVTAEPKIRFYAGAPLVTPDDHAVGTLCVLDRVPRQLTPDQTEALRALSRQVMNQLEMRRKIYEQRHELLARAHREKVLQRQVRQARHSYSAQRQLLRKSAHLLQSSAHLITKHLQRAAAVTSADERREALRAASTSARSLLTISRRMIQRAEKSHVPR